MTKFAVLLDGENVWTIDGAPWLFDTFEAAAAELDETFRDMDDAGMDYEPSEYRIEEVSHAYENSRNHRSTIHRRMAVRHARFHYVNVRGQS